MPRARAVQFGIQGPVKEANLAVEVVDGKGHPLAHVFINSLGVKISAPGKRIRAGGPYHTWEQVVDLLRGSTPSGASA